MIFELTPSLCAQIEYAMENQKQFCGFDVSSSQVIECKEEDVDEENIYSLPAWTSADGYNVLESFVNKYKTVKACAELIKILAEGRGVFKNFKNILKKYPEIERRFNLYKSNQLKSVIYEWYNALRESWGLEALDQDFYEYDDLVLEDFTFRSFNHNLDSENAAFEAGVFFNELKTRFSGELGQSICSFMNAQYEFFSSLSESRGFTCRTLTDEFAGCLTYSDCLSSNKKTVFLTSLFVNKNFRGLGIARELLEKCISSLTENKVQFFIINNSFVPQVLKSTLIRLGFVENDFAFVNELQKN